MSITNNLISNRKRLPNKVIAADAVMLEPTTSWLYNDTLGDPWWQGSAGSAYKWKLTATVSVSTHSSHLTREPFVYNGLDITPGMWVMSGVEFKALKVISIISKSFEYIECIVEDVDRYNTFVDPTGSGNGAFATPSSIIFFELGEDGLPIINPLPITARIEAISQVEARFRVLNPTVEYKFFQLKHNFKEGQVLRLSDTTQLFEQATSNDIYFVGTVTSVGPGPNYFYLSPSTKFLANLEPGLSGHAGDLIWIDNVTGERTTTPTGSNVPIYLQMTNAIPSFVIGSMEDPMTWGQNSIKINNVVIDFGNVPQMIDTAAIITEINQHTINTGVVASLSGPQHSIDGMSSYPSSTPAAQITFRLNGVLSTIETPSINFGTSGDIGYWDIIRSINEQTSSHGIEASIYLGSGLITLTNASGGPINFENITPSVTVGNDKTITDILGVPILNPSLFANRIKLVRMDGGEIVMSNVSGDVLGDLGISSVANGMKPLPLIVDKTLSTNQNYVVADIAARDELKNIRTGDQVFVQNLSNNEWALFVKTGATWTKIADYDSANTDASTLVATVTNASNSETLLGNISVGTRIVNVTVVVDAIFTNGATLSVGLTGQPEIVLQQSSIDLTNIGTYEASSSYVHSGPYDGDIICFLNTNGSMVGSAKVVVSYL